MADRWVNAKFEITVPLDVSPDASDEDKLAAVEECFERFSDHLGSDATLVFGFETVLDSEPEES